MIQLRPYQSHCLNEVRNAFIQKHRSVCIVAPTGAGKSVLCSSVVEQHLRQPQAIGVLIAVPRIELVTQMAEHIRSVAPQYDVGIIAPGQAPSPNSRVQISTIQTLLARPEVRPWASLLILDEAHHYAATDWSTILKDYPHAYTIGLTATPERQDGRPLGDIFTALVVAASYSQLIQQGYLVDCRCFAPDEAVANGLAQDPLQAYRTYADGQSGFAFCASVKQAQKLAEQFTAEGIPAKCITHKTPRAERAQYLRDFKAGELKILTNMNALTEGVDVPSASVCILARTVGHAGNFLQMAGRVLRPAPGKTHATLIDLTGAVLEHGLPTQDREYHLDGTAITHEKLPNLWTCPACGIVSEGRRPEACTSCGFVFPAQEQKQLRIYSFELRQVYAGAQTPADAKLKEFQRLMKLAAEKGWALYFVRKLFRELFHEDGQENFATLPMETKRAEYERLAAVAREKGYKPGWAGVQFHKLFGQWPAFPKRAA